MSTEQARQPAPVHRIVGRIESVMLARDSEILPTLFAFYAPDARVVRDVTANTRKMWNGYKSNFAPKFYDIDAGMKPDHVCAWDNLPDQSGTVDVIVYDPPHIPQAAASEASMKQMADSYGLRHGMSDHGSFLAEASRVLKKDGIIFAKIKDFIHNHRYTWAVFDFVDAVRKSGMTPCDHIIKRDPCGGNLKSGRWDKAHHARCCHCSWVIVRNSRRCEPRCLPPNKEIE